MIKPILCALAVSLLPASLATAQTPVGAAFPIGSYPSNQWAPRLAMEPDGDFVVVWMSGLQDGSLDGVFGQRFAASGTPVSPVFQVNTYTTDDQGFPDVAAGPDGDFVVAWMRVADGYGVSVHARRFDTSGTAIGDEFQVSTGTAITYYAGPRVGRAPDGSFIVSWDGGDDYGIGYIARRYDASGDPVGGEFALNPTTSGAEYNGDLAVEDNGNFVAVWESYAPNGIFGQRYDAAGGRLGGEFRVNANTLTLQHWPRVSVAPGGAFVVAWTGVGEGNQLDVFARRFDSAGNALGNDLLVNTPKAGSDVPHQITHDGQGNFVVTWTSHLGPGSDSRSLGQLFDATGGRRGSVFPVSASPGFQVTPSIASDPDGNFLVAWAGLVPSGGTAGVFAQRFGPAIPPVLGTPTSQNGAVLRRRTDPRTFE